MFLGLDIGSSSSKAVIIGADQTVLANEAVNIGTGTNGAGLAISKAYQTSGLSQEDIRFTVVTGYGRMVFKNADLQITEISCHAKGVVALYPKARSIIDIGGQDAKAIRLEENGRIGSFQMNEKCAAGTGRFFEVMARVFNCSISDLSKSAEEATETVPISSVCTVFAESEVISRLASGASLPAIAKGIHQSVAKRVAGLCNRVGLIPDIVMTGGVAYNRSMVRALEEEIRMGIIVPESPQTMGAFGAALFAREKFLHNEGIV